MTSMMVKTDGIYNPLDIAELVVLDRDWAFDRTHDGELTAEVSGPWCNYHVWFNWQEDAGALTLSCSLDAKFPPKLLTSIHSLLSIANEKLWLGHFEISSEDQSVAFRHTQLMNSGSGTSTEQLNQLIDIALEECQRLYPAFQSVVWGGKTAADALYFAMFETVAEA